MKEAFSMPIQGFDAIRIVSQILSLQALHYLGLCILVPPLLSLFSSPTSLTFAGGPTQVGLIIDWREMARPSSLLSTNDAAQVDWNAIYTEDAQKLDISTRDGAWTPSKGERARMSDGARSWCIVFAWCLTGFFDIISLVLLVRRPTHILDHTLTLYLLHLLFTTYYASSLPTSLFWWTFMVLHAGIVVVWSEQWAVKRELGRSIPSSNLVGTGAASSQETEVLFDPRKEEEMLAHPETDIVELKRLD